MNTVHRAFKTKDKAEHFIIWSQHEVCPQRKAMTSVKLGVYTQMEISCPVNKQFLQSEYSGSSRVTVRTMLPSPVANPLWQGRGYLSYGNWVAVVEVRLFVKPHLASHILSVSQDKAKTLLLRRRKPHTNLRNLKAWRDSDLGLKFSFSQPDSFLL